MLNGVNTTNMGHPTCGDARRKEGRPWRVVTLLFVGHCREEVTVRMKEGNFGLIKEEMTTQGQPT
jgi:hypothetical protein